MVFENSRRSGLRILYKANAGDGFVNSALEKEINSMRGLKVKELKARYRELFGEESPSFSHAHLFRRIAWRLQAVAEGDLSERAKQRAIELAADPDLRLRAPRGFWEQLDAAQERQVEASRDLRLPAVGTELTREYRGRTIRVKVLEVGFEYKGRPHRSLSDIASKVTGTRWNGFSFFGLNKQVQNG